MTMSEIETTKDIIQQGKDIVSKGQIGISESSDFEDETWTFQMTKPFAVSGGTFMIIPTDEFDAINQRHEETMKESLREAFQAGVTYFGDRVYSRPAQNFKEWYNERLLK